MIYPIPQWLSSPETLVSLWGAVGGFVASEFKRREAKLLPPTTQIHFPSGNEYQIIFRIWLWDGYWFIST
jgi:hypothetical protein